jgi:NTE family protein
MNRFFLKTRKYSFLYLITFTMILSGFASHVSLSSSNEGKSNTTEVINAQKNDASLTTRTGATPISDSMRSPGIVNIPKVSPKFALVLGGGAARGFAHIGVIQVLEESGIKPSMVLGTSAGSVVAAIYASGKTGAQLQRIADVMDQSALTDWNISILKRGMMRGEALERFIRQQTGYKNIEQLPMPLGVVATDLQTGEGILFQKGDIGTAVHASSAVPSIFEPVKVGGKEYVDGGLVSPVPVRYARQMGADIVLAVDISSAPEGNPSDDMFKILLQTFNIMSKSINSFELAKADIVVRPSLLGVSSIEFANRQQSIDAGRAAMKQALPKLRALLAN